MDLGAATAPAAPPADPAAHLSRWLAGEDGPRDAPPVPGEGGIPGAGGTALAAAPGPAGSELRLGFGAPEGAHMSLAAQPAAVEARFGDTVLSAVSSTRFDGGDGGWAGSLDPGVHGLALSWRPSAGETAERTDGFLTGLRAGWLREAETLYGAGAQGAFGRLSSDLFVAGASGSFEAGGGRFGMAAEVGHAAPEAVGGLLSDAGPAFSTAFRRSPPAPPRAGRSGFRCGSRCASRPDAWTCRCPSGGRRKARSCASGFRSASRRPAARSTSAPIGPGRWRPARFCASGPC